jgi:hypothetical protein
MLERIIYFALTILILVFCFLVYKTRQYSLDKRLQSHVSWCVTDDSNIYRCNMSLLEWLCNVPHYSKNKRPDCFFPNADKLFLIEDKYWLSGEEELSIAKEIIREYQKELIQKFFSGRLVANRFACKLTDEEYFLLTLKEFLEKYQCETTFHGNSMYNTKEYKSYGYWGAPLFDATYELTDYAVAYHKIYYVTQMYCLTLRENPLDTNALSFQWTEDTKKVLDTKEIKVSRY